MTAAVGPVPAVEPDVRDTWPAYAACELWRKLPRSPYEHEWRPRGDDLQRQTMALINAYTMVVTAADRTARELELANDELDRVKGYLAEAENELERPNSKVPDYVEWNHNREHRGTLRFCSYEMCRAAAEELGR